jgi:hypothetical protein
MVIAAQPAAPGSDGPNTPRGGTHESIHTSMCRDAGQGERVCCPRMIHRPRHLASCVPPSCLLATFIFLDGDPLGFRFLFGQLASLDGRVRCSTRG